MPSTCRDPVDGRSDSSPGRCRPRTLAVLRAAQVRTRTSPARRWIPSRRSRGTPHGRPCDPSSVPSRFSRLSPPPFGRNVRLPRFPGCWVARRRGFALSAPPVISRPGSWRRAVSPSAQFPNASPTPDAAFRSPTRPRSLPSFEEWQGVANPCRRTAVRRTPVFPVPDHLFRLGSTRPPASRPAVTHGTGRAELPDGLCDTSPRTH